MLRTFGLLRHNMQPFFQQFGISGSQWGVLRNLHRAEGEGLAQIRLTDLGKRLLVRPPSITGVVDRLQRMGLLRRTASQSDLRVKNVSLTPKGRELVERVLRDHGARIQSLLCRLSEAEQKQLLGLLDRLTEHLQSAVQNEPPAEALQETASTGDSL